MDKNDSDTKKVPHRAPIAHQGDPNESTLYDLRVEHKPIGMLKPFERNARKHSARQIQQIAASIRQFGFTNPVLIDAENQIIAAAGVVFARYQCRKSSIISVSLPSVPGARANAP